LTTHIKSQRLIVVAEVSDETFSDEEFAHLTECTECFEKWEALLGEDIQA